MKKYVITLLALLFSLSLHAFSQQQLMTRLQQPQTIQGEFTQQRFLSAMSKPITTRGQFTLLKNKGLLWQMRTPFASDLRVTGAGIAQWNGAQWVLNDGVGQAQQVSLFLGLLTGDVAALSEQFDIVLNGTAQDWQLSLIPNGLLMKQIFRRIEIRGADTIEGIELNEVQGDRTLISFEQIRIDQGLSEFARQALL